MLLRCSVQDIFQILDPVGVRCHMSLQQNITGAEKQPKLERSHTERLDQTDFQNPEGYN